MTANVMQHLATHGRREATGNEWRNVDQSILAAINTCAMQDVNGLQMKVMCRVVSHLFTASLAGIGKLPALAGWYIRYGMCLVFFVL